MKTIKKIFNMMLAVAMLLVQLVPTTNVFAAETGTITITNAVEGETYSAYKILTLETYDKTNGNYIYRVTEAWKEFVTTGEGSKYLNIENADTESDDYQTADTYVTWKAATDDAAKQAFTQAALDYAESKGITAIAPTTIDTENKTVTFSGLELGYYVVDSSLGSLCILTTTNPTASIEEKNGVPTVEKEVQENPAGSWGEENDANIGDTVNYRTTIVAQAGAQNYVLYDIMSDGLTLNQSSIVVILNETTTLVKDTDYTVSFTTPGYTFVIDFTDTFEDTLKDNDKIVVTYNATLNTGAVIEGEGNPNETYLKYGDDSESVHDTTTTYTYAFDLEKTKADGTALTGAEFLLYDEKTEGNLIPVVYVDTNSEGVLVYRVAVGDETGETIKAGKVTILGLDADTYYLEETVAPTGYNKLTERQAIEIGTATGDTTYERLSTTVKNYTGTELPSTGGIGTVLFITIGSLLVLGFGVLLVTKLRMSKMEA